MINLIKIIKNKSAKYFYINILLVILFAIFYYTQDIFLIKYRDIAIQYKLLSTNYYSNQANDFIYYLWFSLITQSTLGYAGLINGRGQNIPFNNINSNLFIILNFLQIISIFVVNGLFI